MASTTDDVVVRLRLKDVAKFIADVKSGKASIEGFEKQVDRAEKAAAKATAESGGFGKLGRFFSSGWARTGIFALGGATAAVAGFAIKSTANLEQVTIGFETMLGSAQKAKAFVGQLQQFAAKTPFEMQNLQANAQQMLAFGFSANSVIPSLTAVGDAMSALGRGTEDINRVVLAFGQIKAKGRLQEDELIQLAENGVNAYTYLQRALGLTPQQLTKAVRAGKVDATRAINIILKGMESQYGGMMSRQSHTLTGIWSNLVDSTRNALIAETSPFLPAMERWLQSLVDHMPQIQSWFHDYFGKVIGFGQQAYSAGAGILSGLTSGTPGGNGHALGAGIQSIATQGLTALGAALNGVDWLGLGRKVGAQALPFAVGLLAGLFDVGTMWDAAKKHPWDVVSAVLAIFVIGKFGKAFGAIFEKVPILKWFAPLFKKFGGGYEKWVGPLENGDKAIARAIGRAFEKHFPEAATRIWFFFARIGEFIGKSAPKWLRSLPGKLGSLGIKLVEALFGKVFGGAKAILDGPFGTAIKVLGEGLKEMFVEVGKFISKPFTEAFKAAFNFFAVHWNGTAGRLPGLGSHWQIPLLAKGGTATAAGLSIVGEQGPELLHLPVGASVVPLPRMPDLSEVGAGRDVVLRVDGKDLARAALRGRDRLAARL